MKEYVCVITEGEKRREQSRGDIKRSMLEEDSRKTEQDMPGRGTSQQGTKETEVLQPFFGPMSERRSVMKQMSAGQNWASVW